MSTKILRADAVALCIALGFKTADSWNRKRMNRKMKDLAEMVEDGGIEVDEEAKDHEHLNEVLLQIAEAEGDVEVVQELPVEEPEDEADKVVDATEDETLEDIEKSKQEKSKQEKPKQEKPKQEKPKQEKPKQEKSRKLDRFGNLVGSQGGKINEVLISHPKGVTLERICEVTGLGMHRVRSHVSALVKDKAVMKDDGTVKVVG